MKFESITIKDIAKALGYSTSTVSRALHDSYQIGEEAKKKILDYARKMNYTPNPIALSLRDKRNKSIGIVISEIANSFCSQVINGMESVAHANGYQVSIVQTQESYQKELEAVHYLSSRVDGLLISVSSETKDTSHFRQLHAKGMPMVFFDRVCESIDTHCIVSDNFIGTYNATLHLLKNGYRKIAFLGGSESLDIVQERKRGYMEALNKYKIDADDSLIKFSSHGGVDAEETNQLLNKILKPKNKPDAILSAWDKITTNCYRYFRDRNIKMPESIAMIGFSNVPLTDYLSPSLSVVLQQSTKIGVLAAERLIDSFNKKSKYKTASIEVLAPEIIVRETSAKRI